MTNVDSGNGAWLDRMYDNRRAVPDSAARLARWAALSEQARSTGDCHLDIPYGDHPAERLDVFPAQATGAPVLVFAHGGYWRALDKRDQSFVGPAFTRDGVCVVIPNYALCPAVTVPDIVLQVARAVAWTGRNIARFGGDPRRITVAGHSAGGHLAAMMAAARGRALPGAGLPPDLVRNALSISGLHDLEPLMRTPFLQGDLRLTPQQVAAASPARLPAPAHGTVYVVVGGNESGEYLRQARLLQQAWGTARVPVCEVLPGLDHFGILEALVEPSHRLHQLALDLLRA